MVANDEKNKFANIDEADMKIFNSEDDPYEEIFSKNPLLGNYIFLEKDMEYLHKEARKLIDKMASGTGGNLSNKQKMIIALSVINYSKKFQEGQFIEFITKQYGYKSNFKIYNILMEATYDAIKKNNRWHFCSNEKSRHNYKSTVMIHSISPTRSWNCLFDFLLYFYIHNLACNYVANDPYIFNMVKYIGDKFFDDNADDEKNEKKPIIISSEPYHFLEGVRKLIKYRPKYASKVFDGIIKRIDEHIHECVSKTNDYTDTLVDIWFEEKINDLIKFNKNINKSNVSEHKVIFEYKQIHVDYSFVNGKLSLDIPHIRLNEKSNEICYIEIYHEDYLIEKQSLKVYGNELGRTIEGKFYYLDEYLSMVDNGCINLRVLIKYGTNVIYDSDKKLYRNKNIIVLNGKKEKEISSLEDGNYIAITSKNSNISGSRVSIDFIENIGKFSFYSLKLEDGFTLFVDEEIIAFDVKSSESIRLDLNNVYERVKYFEKGINYEICSLDTYASIFVDENDVEEKYIIVFNGKKYGFSDFILKSSEKINVYKFSIQDISEEKNRLQIFDLSNNRLIIDKYYIFIPYFSYKFDRSYYFTEDEIKECYVKYTIDKESKEITNLYGENYLSVDYKSGVIVFEIPIIYLKEITGERWEKRNYYIDEIDRGKYLKFESLQKLKAKIYVGKIEVGIDRKGFFDLGNTVNANYNGNDSPKSIVLCITDKKEHKAEYYVGKIFFQEEFVSTPQIEYINGQLRWDFGYGFIGNFKEDFYMQIINDKKEVLYNDVVKCNKSIILQGILLNDGKYDFVIYKKSKNIFLEENVNIKKGKGSFICGNYDKIRFDNYKIVIEQILFENESDSRTIDILTTYIDNIQYDEILSNERSSEGICPTYSGTMYYIDTDGNRHNYSFKDKEITENNMKIKTNPVKIIYINDSIMLVKDFDGDALLYVSYYDKYRKKIVYHITDREYSKYKYGSTDLVRYRKEKI